MRKWFRLSTLTAGLARLIRDEEGSYVLYMTLLIPIVIGVAGLATEGGWWLYAHQPYKTPPTRRR